MTFVIGLSLKQNCFAKPPHLNQPAPSIIDNFSNILTTATNLDKDTDTKMINVDGNKFCDYFGYFPIPFDAWLF